MGQTLVNSPHKNINDFCDIKFGEFQHLSCYLMSNKVALVRQMNAKFKVDVDILDKSTKIFLPSV